MRVEWKSMETAPRDGTIIHIRDGGRYLGQFHFYANAWLELYGVVPLPARPDVYFSWRPLDLDLDLDLDINYQKEIKARRRQTAADAIIVGTILVVITPFLAWFLCVEKVDVITAVWLLYLHGIAWAVFAILGLDISVLNTASKKGKPK